MNPDSAPLLDPDLLLRRLGGAREIAQEVYGDLAASLPARIQECRHALAAGDSDGLRQALHTIKGSAATAAAEQVALRASNLGVLARDLAGNEEAVRSALDDLEVCVNRTLAAAGVSHE